MQLKSKYKSGYKRKKNFRKYLFIIISTALISGVLGTGGYLLYYMSHKDAATAQVKESSTIMYQAAEPIQRGQLISASMLVEIKDWASCDVSYYSSLDCIGQVAIVDIPQGMTLMQNMCRLPDVKSGEREVECEIITLSDNLLENDYVDVRLMLPNGEDYIVLAKKGVHDLFKSEDGQEEVCYLWLSEEEILYYSAAVVDAYLYQGASLYTTKYIEPTLQEASLVTYVPSLGTITMMKENPNLFDLAIGKLKKEDRKLLENRLTDYLNLDIRERNWNVSSNEQTQEEMEQSENKLQDENANKIENTNKIENARQDNDNEDSSSELDENTMNDQTNQQDAGGNQENYQGDKEGTAGIETEVSSEEDKVDASAFVED